MTYEELKAEANAMGYDIVKIRPKKEKFLPCTCGCVKRDHSYRWVNGAERVTLTCQRCGKSISGKSDLDAKRKWNSMIDAERKESE